MQYWVAKSASPPFVRTRSQYVHIYENKIKLLEIFSSHWEKEMMIQARVLNGGPDIGEVWERKFYHGIYIDLP